MLASLPVVLLLASAAALAAGNPTLPTRYHVKGVIVLPTGQIYEPYEAWVDMDKGNSRIDYYGGEGVGAAGMCSPAACCLVRLFALSEVRPFNDDYR